MNHRCGVGALVRTCCVAASCGMFADTSFGSSISWNDWSHAALMHLLHVHACIILGTSDQHTPCSDVAPSMSTWVSAAHRWQARRILYIRIHTLDRPSTALVMTMC